ncbi:MAG: DUF3598 family protein [Desmonostoc vinosum HA7617-LM4]|nr:DUF3598 family protein [Desmonostoc vinosum HA7617-LM4]
MNQDSLIENATEAQIQNWDNFCHHLGDWHGTWTAYSSEGELNRKFQCIRCFHLDSNGCEVNHQNKYTYADGTTKVETFGPHKKPFIKSLHFNNSFSWGSIEVKPDSMFFFETGFKYAQRRRSAVARYNENGTVDILIISEHLGSYVEESAYAPASQISNWQGTITSMTPDWTISSTVTTSWTKLDSLDENYITLHLNDGISISIPRYVESGKEFFLAAEWLVNPTLLQRGIRHFSTSGFTKFTLEIFTDEA